MPCNTVLQCSQASLQACDGALSRIKNYAQAPWAVQLGTMQSSITLIHSSTLSFRPGSTKCNEGALSQAPMMPKTISPRVVSVCDAVNRSGVSSSSSASIFEVLRDSQIGSDALKLSGTREKMTMFPQAEERSKNVPKTGLDVQLRAWVAVLCTRRRLREKDMCQDNCEIWLTPTDPRVLMVGLLAQPEKGLVGPDDVAELQFWSSSRLLANASSQWVRRREHATKQEHEAHLEIAEGCVADSTKQPKQREKRRETLCEKPQETA